MDVIHDLYIIHKGGLKLFRHEFTTGDVNPDLFSSFMTAVDSFSAEVLPKIYKNSDDYLRTIDRGTFKLLIEKGEFVAGIIISEEDNEYVRKTLKSLIKSFEIIYYKYLVSNQIQKLSLYKSFKEEVLKKMT